MGAKKLPSSHPKIIITCNRLPIMLQGQNLTLKQLSNIYHDEASVPALWDASYKKSNGLKSVIPENQSGKIPHRLLF